MSLRLLYNGYIHDSEGIRNDVNGKVVITIRSAKLPRGWIAERGTGLDLELDYDEIEPDESGLFDWIVPDVQDLDANLRKKMD